MEHHSQGGLRGSRTSGAVRATRPGVPGCVLPVTDPTCAAEQGAPEMQRWVRGMTMGTRLGTGQLHLLLIALLVSLPRGAHASCERTTPFLRAMAPETLV